MGTSAAQDYRAAEVLRKLAGARGPWRGRIYGASSPTPADYGRSLVTRTLRVMQRISGFLRAASPNRYCNDCLAMSLGLDKEAVRRETVHLIETNGVEAAQGACTLCGGTKAVVTAR